MTLNEYFQNVAFQFYSKVEEADFFLQAAIDNHAAYVSTPEQRTIRPFEVAQYYFSAYISALISTWEISKLTNKLANELDGIENKVEEEWNISNRFPPFMSVFPGATRHDFALFQFLKQARNATIHDGTLALNGGSNDMFCFFGPVDRFDARQLRGAKSKFQRTTVFPPDVDAIEVMRQMGVRLVPFFEKRLRRPSQLSSDLHEMMWKSHKNKVRNFVAKFSPAKG